MSDAPETDRRIIQQSPRMCGCGYESEIVFADFARRLERERDGWREAAYSLGEAIPASWEELQPPAEQLRKFKEMVELQNKKTEKLLDNADKHSKMYP